MVHSQTHVGTNSDAYIYSSIKFEVSQYQQWFVFNPRVEDLNARDLSLAASGKGAKKKFTNTKLDIL